MEKPAYLKKGDKVVILSTARKVSKEEMKPAVKILKDWGLIVCFGENLFSEHHQYAGTTEERINDLQQALNDNSIAAIFCARGGYGTVKLIDSLDFNAFIRFPKWIVGYSDITVLHNHIFENFNIPTLHATMPINYATTSNKSLQSLKQALFGEKLRYNFPNYILNKTGLGEGILVGGNLSILYSLTGTDSSIRTKNKILFIEDLDEYLYHIDRIMMNLKRAKMLENLAGLIVGGMTGMHDNTIAYGKNASEIIADAVKEYSFPICFNFDAGHTNINLALKMGCLVKLSVKNDTCSLSF